MKILIVNGPNLNLLGRREPEIYGSETMDDVLQRIRASHPGHSIEYFQSNHEGALIDRIQSAGYGPDTADAVVINAGGYSHTSVALRDAIAAIAIPVAEVHISNIAAREPFRHQSMLTAVCRGSIAGFGTRVYDLAVEALIQAQ